MFKILSLDTGKQLFDILIPFLCQRCGACCQQLGVRLSSLDIKAIADYLTLTPEQVIAGYMSRAEALEITSGGYEWMKRCRPCPFLSPQKECIIYPVRPSGCRSYPIYTLLGPEGVDCPGMKLMQKVVSVLGRGIPHELHHPGGEMGERPSPTQLRRIINKLKKNSLPDEVIRELIQLNRWEPFLENPTKI